MFFSTDVTVLGWPISVNIDNICKCYEIHKTGFVSEDWNWTSQHSHHELRIIFMLLWPKDETKQDSKAYGFISLHSRITNISSEQREFELYY